MEEEVQYCKNCKRDISVKNFIIHSAHCDRKIQLCDQCSEPVPRSEFEKHAKEFHSKEPCSDCGISVEKRQIEKHKENCVKRLVPCEYCELELPLENLSEHIAVCGSRTDQCPKCKKYVIIKDLEKHPTKCLKREIGVKKLLSCDYCELEIPSDYLSDHLAVCGSQTEQCPKCKKYVMRKDREKHPTTCLRKEPETITCEYCDLQINLNEYEVHTAMCGTRTEICILCNQHIMVMDRDTHFASCQKTLNSNDSTCDYCGGSFNLNYFPRHVEFCKLQTEKCDRCNNYIQRNDIALHLTICKQKKRLSLNFPCEYCGEVIPHENLQDHAAACGSQTQKCGKCGRHIELKNMKTHSSVCQDQLRLNFPCKYCGNLFPRGRLEEHAALCGSLSQKCEISDSYIGLKDLNTHSNKSQQIMPKTNGVCSVCHETVPWVEMNIHSTVCARMYNETDDYEHQNQFNEHALRKESQASTEKNSEAKNSQLNHKDKRCPFCFEKFPYLHFTQHLEVCEERPYNCEKCLKAMPYRKKEEHVRNCRGQETERLYENAYMLLDEEKYDNKELKKLKKCPFCNTKLPDVLFQYHVEDCKHQQEKCILCGEKVAIKDMQEHELLKCNNRNVKHPEAIPEPCKNFENMRHLAEKVEVCPSCKCKIPDERYNDHLHLCYEGWTQCHFCGEKILKYSEHGHFQKCLKILEMLEDKNVQGKTKTGEKSEGKSFSRTLLGNVVSLFSSKEKICKKNNALEVFEDTRSSQLNRRQSYEKGSMTPVQPSSTIYNELPCEFCGEMWPFELIIEHQSGCRPDLVSFPKTDEGSEDQKFATAAAAAASRISHTPDLGASPKSAQKDDNEWIVKSRRNKSGSNRENIEYCIKERNVPQKQQLSAKEKFFYYPSQDSDEVSKNQAGISNKKRYSQVKKSPEISRKQYTELMKSSEISKKQISQNSQISEVSKTKSDKEIGDSCEVKKADSRKYQFTSYKFSTSGCNGEAHNNSNSLKENGGASSSADGKIHDETKKSNYYSGLNSVKPKFDKENKAVGAERTERKKMMHSRENIDADLSLVNKEFGGISLLKSITFDEPSKVFETAESCMFDQYMPTIWNKEYNYDDKGKAYILSKTNENIEHRALKSSIQDADYDEKNDETFGSDFLESMNKNRNKEEENDTHSISDDMFYDADDGSDKLIDIVNDNIQCNTPEEKLRPYDFNNLIKSSWHQREHLNHNSYGDLNVNIRQEEEDFNPKDSDFNAYHQFLFKGVKQTDEGHFDRTTGDCKCGNKECCCAASSIMQKTSLLKACTFKDTSSTKSYSEPMNVGPFVVETKTSTKLKSKRSSLDVTGKKKVVSENFANEEVLKWKKWRTRQASDSE